MTKSFQVIRTHLSPYQAKNFQQIESSALEMLPGITYRQLSDFTSGQPTILITNTHTQLPTLPLELLNGTELIVHPNSGYDNFRNSEKIWNKIPLVVGHEIRAQAVAEYSLSCLFQGLTELPQHLSWDHSRLWNRSLIKGCDIWIFGYGHIGKILAQTLSALGANLTIVDPFIRNCPYKHLRNWKEGFVRNAQVVITACGLNDTSHHLFGDEFFDGAHPELIFINGARGGLVKEASLRKFLLAHSKAQAFLDVFETEPFTEEWHHFPQVWKTSHIAGVHKVLDQGIIQFEVKVISDYLNLPESEFLAKYSQELLQNKKYQGVII
jgi:D-3-phosphoglycerate dehydrogenase / 2-oxoglutarate reductase